MPNFVFNAQANEFEIKNALFMAQCAKLAYETEAAVQQQAAEWGFNNCRIFSTAETDGFVLGNDDIVVVAFRGTEPHELRDWLTDSKIGFNEGPVGRIHHGFNQALDLVYEGIKTTVKEFQSTNQSLWVTGHSLGAALATLLAARLEFQEGIAVAGLYNFGSPRVGDKDFSQAFNEKFAGRCFRYVHNNDAVPHLPPEKFHYDHINTFCYFDMDGIFHNDISKWDTIRDRIEGRLESLLDHLGVAKHLFAVLVQPGTPVFKRLLDEQVRELLKPDTDGIRDHSMENYIRLVLKQAGE